MHILSNATVNAPVRIAVAVAAGLGALLVAMLAVRPEMAAMSMSAMQRLAASFGM